MVPSKENQDAVTKVGERYRGQNPRAQAAQVTSVVTRSELELRLSLAPAFGVTRETQKALVGLNHSVAEREVNDP